MGELQAPRYIMPMIVFQFSFQHCDEDTLMCTLHGFLSNSVRFIHTSTVTGSYCCSEKKYAYASRTS